MMMTMMMTLITKSCTTSRMALGTLARFFVRIVTTIIVSIAHLPVQYTAIVRLTTKLSIRTTACFCYSNRHLHRQVQNTATRRALGTAHVPPTKVFRRLAVNKTIFKPRLAAATGGQYVQYTWDFSDVIKFRVAALIRYRRKQSGSGIQTIIRIGLKS